MFRKNSEPLESRMAVFQKKHLSNDGGLIRSRLIRKAGKYEPTHLEILEKSKVAGKIMLAEMLKKEPQKFKRALALINMSHQILKLDPGLIEGRIAKGIINTALNEFGEYKKNNKLNKKEAKEIARRLESARDYLEDNLGKMVIMDDNFRELLNNCIILFSNNLSHLLEEKKAESANKRLLNKILPEIQNAVADRFREQAGKVVGRDFGGNYLTTKNKASERILLELGFRGKKLAELMELENKQNKIMALLKSANRQGIMPYDQEIREIADDLLIAKGTENAKASEHIGKIKILLLTRDNLSADAKGKILAECFKLNELLLESSLGKKFPRYFELRKQELINRLNRHEPN